MLRARVLNGGSKPKVPRFARDDTLYEVLRFS
jgi:hypothetical protein